MQDCLTRMILRSLVAFAFFLALMFFSAGFLAAQPPESPPTAHDNSQIVFAGQGIMAGEVTDGAALVQIRLTMTDRMVDGDLAGVAGVAKFNLNAIDDSAPEIEKMAMASPDHDFIARVSFTGLRPNTRYRCETQIGSSDQRLHAGPSVEFKTLPGKDLAVPVSFAVVTGMNYARFHGPKPTAKGEVPVKSNVKKSKAYRGPDKDQGYPALETIKKMRPDFFVGTGDNVYYDTPNRPRAKEIQELRQKWHEQFVQPRFLELFAEVPALWMVDDHDYRVNDCDNTGDYLPSADTAKKILLEQLPYADAEVVDAKTYRTYRLNKDLQVWFTENRFFRSPNKMPDGPDKTIWGAEQKRWLKETLDQSDAKFKVLITPTPMVGPDDLQKTDNHCNIGGFQHERDEFFEFVKTSGLDEQNFFLVCGDRHWQYHALDPSGVEEFSCGALVDANSRLGKSPGHPASTDPEGKIEQPYTQQKSSGGFLIVRCEPAKDNANASLKFEFFDEKGESLYTCTK